MKPNPVLLLTLLLTLPAGAAPAVVTNRSCDFFQDHTLVKTRDVQNSENRISRMDYINSAKGFTLAISGGGVYFLREKDALSDYLGEPDQMFQVVGGEGSVHRGRYAAILSGNPRQTARTVTVYNRDSGSLQSVFSIDRTVKDAYFLNPEEGSRNPVAILITDKEILFVAASMEPQLLATHEAPNLVRTFFADNGVFLEEPTARRGEIQQTFLVFRNGKIQAKSLGKIRY